MRTIKNLKLINNVLSKELPNFKFGVFDVSLVSDDSSIKELYIGNKDKEDTKDKTLFKYNKDKDCYYDILDKGEIYYTSLERLYEVDSDNHCTNLESLEEKIKKLEKEKR